jgi:hypothetical protein
VALIAAAQVVEHYEITCYRALKAWAEHLQIQEAVDLIDESNAYSVDAFSHPQKSPPGEGGLEADTRQGRKSGHGRPSWPATAAPDRLSPKQESPGFLIDRGSQLESLPSGWELGGAF